MKTVAIVGCGWFGLALAQALIAQGHRVKASKREASAALALKQHGIEGFALNLNAVTDPQIATIFNDCDAIVINIPPALANDTQTPYLTQLERLHDLISHRKWQRIIFISSTGVYPPIEQEMLEADAKPHSASSELLLAAEAIFSKMENCTIVRFAGIVGKGRHPGNFFAVKHNIPDGNIRINLVHLDDCVQAISLLIHSQTQAPIYNLCAPKHPSKAEFYTKASEYLAYEKPHFIASDKTGKTINAQLICQELGFKYRYQDPFDMLDAC